MSAKDAQLGWDNMELKYQGIIEIFDKETTRKILLKNNYYKKFEGRAKNRTLQKENLKLYKSIYENTKELNEIFWNKKHQRQFYKRVKFIVYHNYDIESISCHCGKHYNCDYTKYNNFCRFCKPSYPSIEYFKRKYKQDWKIQFEKDQKKRKKIFKDILTKEWFMKKYKSEWKNKYINHYKKVHANLKTKYSKISQDLFWKLYDKIDNSKCYFAELNKEYIVGLKASEISLVNQSCYFLDFLYKNKNIEFDGSSEYYKKSDEYMNNRDSLIESRGIEVLRINENDYYKNEDLVINTCMEFLIC